MAERFPSLPAAVIRSLTNELENSNCSTMMGLQVELKNHTKKMEESFNFKFDHPCGLIATSDIFLRQITKTSLKLEAQNPDVTKSLDDIKPFLIQTGRLMEESANNAAQRIAKQSVQFFPTTSGKFMILIYGFNEIVFSLLEHAKKNCSKMRIIICGYDQQDEAAMERLSAFDSSNIEVVDIIGTDSLAKYMEQVSMVITGSYGVCENGGVINKLGTFTAALVAKSFNVPVYVVAERFRFTRMFPISQRDLENELGNHAKYSPTKVDFTPPQFINLLFTDLGVFTPSAVSDELIKLYQ